MAKSTENPNTLQILKADLKAKNPGRLYIFHGEETVDYFAILYYGNADGTHSIVVSVRRLNVE